MSHHYFEEHQWNYYPTVISISLFLIFSFIWACFSEIDESIKGNGKVIPSGQTRLVQHLEGGIITDILVAEGDSVQDGQSLFRIQNQYFISTRKENLIKLSAFEAKLLRLGALLNQKDQVIFKDDMTKDIPLIIENEVQIFESQKKKYDSQIAILQEQLSQKRAQIKETEIKIENLLIEYNLALENMKIQEELNTKGIISREKYLQHLSVKQKLFTQLEEARYRLPIIRQEIEEATKKIDMKMFEIRAELLQAINEAQLEIKKLEETIKADQDRDIRINVISPTKGIVNKIHFNTIGGIVKSGETIAEISPLEDELMIEAKIRASDRAYIYPGQNVSIEITAYDLSKYGLLKGKLVNISPDSTSDERGNSTYTIKIKANDYKFDENSPIIMGMTANVNILIGKRTILYYLIKPLKEISYKALSEH